MAAPPARSSLALAEGGEKQSEEGRGVGKGAVVRGGVFQLKWWHPECGCLIMEECRGLVNYWLGCETDCARKWYWKRMYLH
jgi:hypothetical protein